jgi:Leucine-rich repeat (LRR) protein
VGQLAQLRSLDCFVNALTGTIPASFGNLINLRFLDLSINQMHGSIPDTLSGMVSMTYLHVADNAFTGTVPQSISVMTNLSTLHLSNNMFKGTLPAAIATFQQLRFVLVEKNFLSGQISSFVDSTQQSALLTLLLAGNRFTGSLPADVFHLPSLQSVHCDNNCLSGSLPDSICDNPGLRLLSLNGMHTSKACRHSLFPGLSSVYDLPAGTISGSIPTCLYELPLLELLDLSSNGLSGSLPHEVNFGALLMNLSASHNNLKGELPAVFQERAWRRLDLSYNRITGALEDTFAVQTRASSLQLRNNRLSGNIPSQLVNATDIAILPGNTFACDVRKRELPANDPAKLTYQCGTSTFDGAYYTWMAMAFALLVGITCFYWVRKKEIQVVDTFLSIVYRVRTLLDIRDLKDSHGVSYKHRMRRYKKISDMCELCVKLSNYVSLVIVFVLLPVYTGMSAYYNTYTYQYAYNVSLIYQSGKVPAAICMTLLLGLLIFSYACFVVLLRSFQRQCALFEREINYDASAVEFRESASVKEDVFTTEKALVYMGCVVVDLVVVFAANISFVLVVLKGDEVFLFLAQGALSVFKILWGSVCSSVVYYLAVHTKFKSHNLKKGMLFVLFFVTIFNNIVVPCLVIMAISTTCFYNIAEQSPPVNSDFYVVDCAGVSESKCTSDSYVIASTPINFNPPFTYSYQCSASFVTAYAPSFVYMCIVSGFMIPAARYLSQVIAPRLTPGTIWYKLIYPHIPKLLRPITAESPVASRYFDSRKMIVSLLNNLGVMMTFGAVFPPLAIAVLMTTFCRVFFSRLEIKRFLRAAAKLDRVDMIERIDADCAGVGSDSMLIRSMWTLLTLSCWFYALFLFDTLGDDTGLDGAYWVLIVMLLLPIVLRAAFVCYTGTYLVRTRERLVSSVSSQSATTLEMIIKLQQEVRSPMSTTAEVQEGVGDESL